MRKSRWSCTKLHFDIESIFGWKQMCVTDASSCSEDTTLYLKRRNMNHLSALSIFIYMVAVGRGGERCILLRLYVYCKSTDFCLSFDSFTLTSHVYCAILSRFSHDYGLLISQHLLTWMFRVACEAAVAGRLMLGSRCFYSVGPVCQHTGVTEMPSHATCAACSSCHVSVMWLWFHVWFWRNKHIF